MFSNIPGNVRAARHRILKSAVVVTATLSIAGMAAACGSSEEPAAAPEVASSSTTTTEPSPPTTTVTSVPPVVTEPSVAPAPAVPPAAVTPEPVAAPVFMPAVVCLNLQTAQNVIQSAGVFFSRSEDATGEGRSQINDSNWIVVGQTPGVGVPIEEGTAVLSVVKVDEPNNC